jgi:hypothetical protein
MANVRIPALRGRLRVRALARGRPLLAVALVAALDGVVAAVRPPLLLTGVLDEIGHVLSTAVLLLAGRRTLGDRMGVATGTALVATVLIDVDHVPRELFGNPFLTKGTPRPYPHSVATVVLLAALALSVRRERTRRIVMSCAAGVGFHLVRDVGTAPVALAWPFWWGGLRVPHALYLLVLLAAGLLCTVGGGGVRPGGTVEPRPDGTG